jgi:hypothetical protein
MSPRETEVIRRSTLRRRARRTPLRHAIVGWRGSLLRHPQWWGALLSALITAALLSAV